MPTCTSGQYLAMIKEADVLTRKGMEEKLSGVWYT